MLAINHKNNQILQMFKNTKIILLSENKKYKLYKLLIISKPNHTFSAKIACEFCFEMNMAGTLLNFNMVVIASKVLFNFSPLKN